MSTDPHTRSSHRRTVIQHLLPFLGLIAILFTSGTCAEQTCHQPIMAKITKNAHTDLYKSEPNPEYFGNPANPSGQKTGWTNKNWLKSIFHFNFAESHSGRNNFGVLRVMNDDLVQPKRGFGTHSHSNMEIATYIVEGELTHQDSMGTSESLPRGAIQYMSAGTGVRHSEFNHGKKPLRFIQMWIVPEKNGLKPNYGSFVGDKEARLNQLHHIVSNFADTPSVTPVKVHQDVNMYVSEVTDANVAPEFTVKQGRMAYVLCMEGDVTLNERTSLVAHDSADVIGPGVVKFQVGKQGAHFLFVEMAQK
eukprot:m.37253 g.37253  ORF g.37253 m.37253 type:complete len:306 (-) comp17611_c1_seq1:196-1113(-)